MDTEAVDTPEVEPEGLGAGDGGTALGASVSGSSKSVSISRGSSITVYCYIRDTRETVYLNYSSSTYTTYGHKWGSYNSSGAYFPLTITGYAKGTGTSRCACTAAPATSCWTR